MRWCKKWKIRSFVQNNSKAEIAFLVRVRRSEIAFLFSVKWGETVFGHVLTSASLKERLGFSTVLAVNFDATETQETGASVACAKGQVDGRHCNLVIIAGGHFDGEDVAQSLDSGVRENHRRWLDERESSEESVC